MKCLLEYVIYNRFQLSKEALEGAQLLLKNTSNVWSTGTGHIIRLLWAEESVRRAYGYRGTLFPINDTADYFFDNIDRINSSDYIPTIFDVLRVRVRSQGIEEAEFIFDKRMFQFVDVGGQRAQRRKWIHCFDDVSAILYCSSLTEYDLPLREDPRFNRLEDSRSLFAEVCHQEAFKGRAIIFFLNKTDLFREKLRRSPLQAFQPDYVPPTEDITDHLDTHIHSASEFIKQLFMSTINPNERDLGTIFVHFTCALDTRQVEVIIRAVRKWLLDELFKEIGVDIM
jgi:GTPase SAR1 family protein